MKSWYGTSGKNIIVLVVCNAAGKWKIFHHLGMGISPYQIHIMESWKMGGHVSVFVITIMGVFN